MNCPNCNTPINDKLISKHLASKGGEKSKRKIGKAAQEKMQAARRKKKDDIKRGV